MSASLESSCAKIGTEMADQPIALSRRGRPRKYSPGVLMGIWVYVKAGTGRTGSSINKFCEKSSFTLADGVILKGATLRRLFYQAISFLEEEDHGLAKRMKRFGLISRNAPPQEGQLEPIWHLALEVYKMTQNANENGSSPKNAF